MRPSFNVLDAPWIPVVTLDGTKELLGIRETLNRAQELKEISAVSPLEEFSVYRFLSVFLMDALRPKRTSAIRKLLKQGCFDMEQIEEYISLCEEEGVSFDLFDEERPFMQSVPQEKLTAKPITNIDYFLPSGNNHLHFNHERIEMHSVSAAQAIRLLLALQQFCTSGLQGPSGVNGAPPYFGVVKGNTLFETLVYTLVPTQTIDIPFDEPPVIWRSSEVVVTKKEVAKTSWLRGMLFPARIVKLVLPDENMRVTQVYLGAGEDYKHKDNWTDPFVSYRFVKTRVPLRPQREKPVWRNFNDFININGNQASQLVTQYIRISDSPYTQVTLYGVATDNAKYLDVMRHDLRFRSDIAENDEIVKLIKRCIESAEQIAKKLKSCLRKENVVPESVAQDAVSRFYGCCEEQFWKLCEECMSEETIQEQYRNWCRMIGQSAKDAYSNALVNVNLRGKELRKAAVQQKWLFTEIKKIKEEAEV